MLSASVSSPSRRPFRGPSTRCTGGRGRSSTSSSSVVSGFDTRKSRRSKAARATFEALAGVRVAPKTAEKLEARKQAEAAAAASRKQEATVRKNHEAQIKKAEAALERARRRMREAEAAL